MPSLLANPIDDFFFALIEPPAEYEAEVTAELWRIAPQFRTGTGEGDHEIYDYQPESTEAMPKTDFARGYSDGYAGDKTGLFQHRRNKEYLAGHAAGSEKRLSEHRSTVDVYVAAETNGGSGQRVIRGKAQY